jgi:hypothetical protein
MIVSDTKTTYPPISACTRGEIRMRLVVVDIRHLKMREDIIRNLVVNFLQLTNISNTINVVIVAIFITNTCVYISCYKNIKKSMQNILFLNV